MRRSLVAFPLVVALVALAGACGNGGGAAIPTTTLTPTTTATPTSTATGSPSGTASPGPGSSPSASASPTSGKVTLSPSPNTSPPPAGIVINDAEIKATIYHDFGLTAMLMQAGIKVLVHHRVVYLSGTVTSKAIKTKAEQIAVAEIGVIKVISSIVVKAEGAGGY